MENENVQANVTEETMTIPDGLDLFGEGDAATDAAEAEAAEGPAEEAQGDDAQASAKPDMHKVKFNGEERELTYDELITAAQKGLNYDHIAAKAKDADKWKKSAELVEQFAAAAGISVEEYMQAALEQVSQREIRELTDRGMSDDDAKEFLALKKEHAAAEKRKAADQDAAAVKAKYDRLVEVIKSDNDGKIPKEFDKLPDEMAKLINDGMEPIEAYYKYQLGKEREKTAAAKTAAASKSRVVGSAKGTAGTSSDAFLSALWG